MTSSSELSHLYHEALKDYRENRLEEAGVKLSQILSLDSSHEDAYEAFSVILYNQKKYDEAIRLLEKWITVNPDAVMSHTNLSRCYVAKGMILEAEKEQAEARRLTWKAELKAKKKDLPKIDYEEQIGRFKEVIELDPADVLGYFSLGTAYLDSGRKREAMETFEKAIEVDPGHSSSYLGLGLALEELGDKKKAKEIFSRGIKIAEGHGDVMTQRKMESRIRAIENPA